MNRDETIGWKNDTLSRTVIECIIRVHQVLGPGFLEGIYQNALAVELRGHGLDTEAERRVEIRYQDVVVGRHRLDLVVEGRLVVEGSMRVEAKAVSALNQARYARVRSCLKATRLCAAILVHFATAMADDRRVER